MNASTSNCATASLSDSAQQLLDVIDERFTVRFEASPGFIYFTNLSSCFAWLLRGCRVASVWMLFVWGVFVFVWLCRCYCLFVFRYWGDFQAVFPFYSS